MVNINYLKSVIEVQGDEFANIVYEYNELIKNEPAEFRSAYSLYDYINDIFNIGIKHFASKKGNKIWEY